MSKIGKQPIKIPEGVEVAVRDGHLEFKHKNNAAALKILEHVTAAVNDGELSLALIKTSSRRGPTGGRRGLCLKISSPVF